MKGKSFLIGLLLCLGLFTGFQKDKDKISWFKDKPLVWADFKGKPQPVGKKSALAHTGIKTDFAYEKGVLTANVASYFRKDKSWVKKDFVGSKEGLKHEQGHFDLTEIYARKIRKELLNKSFKLSSFQEAYKEIYERNVNELDKVQDQYDEETNHHLNKETQTQWNEKIHADLNELEDYHSTQLTLNVSK